LQLDEDHQQQRDHGQWRAVDDEQRHQDDRDAHQGDRGYRAVPADADIGGEGRGAGDECFDSWRRRSLRDDVLHGLDRLVGHGVTRFAGDHYLNVGGLTVIAFCGRTGQRITPEVLDVLNVLGVAA
jgi:hypothetical protein